MGLERLPLFPLPDVVLFPHAVLPLHIFEPRYRAMTRDALAGDRVLSIVRLRPGFEAEYEARPAVFAVAGLGEIIDHQALPDGRYNIFVRGLSRIGIDSEHAPVEPYRLVTAHRLHDTYSQSDLGIAASALRQLAKQLAGVLPQGGDTLRSIVDDAAEPAALSDVLAASCVVDPDERQRLLETLDVGKRIATVTATVSELLMRLSKSNRGAAN